MLAIAFNQPLYGPGRQLLGVIGVDFVLSQLNTWHAEVWKDKNGFALIVERNGMVVASSRPGLTSTGPGSKTKRVRLDQLPDPLVQATNRRLQELGGLAAPSSLASTQTVQYRDNTYPLGLHSWGQAQKLDWLLITALRSDQIVQASQRHALIALLLSLGAVATAVVVTIRVRAWLLAPLERLQAGGPGGSKSCI